MTPIEHYTHITTETIKRLQDQGIIRLTLDPTNKDPLDVTSKEAQELITNITTNIYNNLVQHINTHRPPELQ